MFTATQYTHRTRKTQYFRVEFEGSLVGNCPEIFLKEYLLKLKEVQNSSKTIIVLNALRGEYPKLYRVDNTLRELSSVLCVAELMPEVGRVVKAGDLITVRGIEYAVEDLINEVWR